MRISDFRVVGVLLLFGISSCGGDSLEDLLTNCTESSLIINSIVSTDSSCDVPGSLEINVSGGVGAYEYSLNGAVYQVSNSFSISAGQYTVYVRDEKGCSVNKSATVNAENGSVEIVDVVTTQGDCGAANGTISIDAIGGTGNLTYQLDNGTLQSLPSFNNVSTGQHSVTVTDAVDCTALRDVWIPSGVSLADVIMPIMLANCAKSSNCHSSSAPRIDLSNPSIVISKSAAIITRTQNGTMPPMSQPKLSQQNIDLIACWVGDGALNN